MEQNWNIFLFKAFFLIKSLVLTRYGPELIRIKLIYDPDFVMLNLWFWSNYDPNPVKLVALIKMLLVFVWFMVNKGQKQ